MRRSALAFICTSTLCVAALTATAAGLDPTAVATLETEAQLARKPDIYLLLDPPARRLAIKSRGLTLDSIAIKGVEVVEPGRVLGRRQPVKLEVPVVLTITQGPGDSARDIIAPNELKPYQGDDAEAEPTPAPPGAPRPTATPEPEAPPSFHAPLDNGWDLWICDRLPGPTLWSRFTAAIRDGWRRLLGYSPVVKPTLTVAMAPDDAKRLYHLVTTGRAVLITYDSE